MEEYTPLTVCDRCQAVEKHVTSQCPEPASCKVCSECGSRQHSYRACDAEVKFCVNCKTEGHSARAMKCPVRKQALKVKRAARTESNNNPTSPSASYASTAKRPSVAVSSVPAQHGTSPVVCLVNAHLRNAVRPGTFQTSLSADLARNGLPDVQLDPDQPSKEIIRELTGGVISLGNPPPVSPAPIPPPPVPPPPVSLPPVPPPPQAPGSPPPASQPSQSSTLGKSSPVSPPPQPPPQSPPTPPAAQAASQARQDNTHVPQPTADQAVQSPAPSSSVEPPLGGK